MKGEQGWHWPPVASQLAKLSALCWLTSTALPAQAIESDTQTQRAYQHMQAQANTVATGKAAISTTHSPAPATGSANNIKTSLSQTQPVTDALSNVSHDPALYAACAKLNVDAARLACFDQLTQTGQAPNYARKQPLDIAKTFKSTLKGKPKLVLAGQADNRSVKLSKKTKSRTSLSDGDTDDQQAILNSVGISADQVDNYTPLSLAYDLDKNSELGTWTARPYRPNYLLPLYVNASPNRHPSTPTQKQVDYTDNKVRNTELKLQVSLKTKAMQDLFGSNADLWFGYTQQSHWQVYNEDNSRPFRATDYEPEVFLTQPVKASLPFGGRLRMLGAGAVHQSNGQSDPLSRSWNRLYVMGGAEWDRLTIIPRLWTRLSTKTGSGKDDNPDITDYLGYGDLRFTYDLNHDQSLGGTLRYNPSTKKGAVQLDYVRPLTDNLKGYVQIFQGYGESLIDYNHSDTTVGVGVMLNDWQGL